MLEKKIVNNLDYVLLFGVFMLIGIGIMIIGSATHANIDSPNRYYYVFRQALFAVVNIFIGYYLLRFDYRMLKDLAKPMYIFNIIMLLAVMFFGRTVLGAQRWIQLGPFSIQPSEFAKAIMIIALAAYVDKRVNTLDTLYGWFPVFAYVFVP
ncbi:MAG: FtsW/RodA/SpoVE family cell cycle protein, partial [Acidaminococcaceae bacterium]|nr:FtsW/RodA/SpoVE family cell cycle protein [Acidaminococcaceae bacterium]